MLYCPEGELMKANKPLMLPLSVIGGNEFS